MAAAALERRVAELSTLNAIGDILNREADFGEALRLGLTKLVELLDLTAGWVFVTQVVQGDSHQGAFGVAATTGLPPALSEDENRPLCKGSCDCQWLFRQGQLDAGVNIVHCSRLESADGDKGGLELHASVPLLGRTGPVGILNLAAAGPEPFDAETLTFLTAVGRQLGTAFERSRLLSARTEAARHHAERCLAATTAAGLADFDLAYAHEVNARALALAGRHAESAAAWVAAKAVFIADPEDRAVVEADFADASG